ncbi:hypothetical protein HMPREF0201_03043 [Cedecea davisae DSM 4568]|uniref:Uncharacterized protein n=1 Tax=Cedecea davisae DSM 4568 TaxID=566551 RepID=S3IPY9_9ENTR|nr:hypothetical protein HMPREF0201_03043 [Cedecea davisae DSM 4568]
MFFPLCSDWPKFNKLISLVYFLCFRTFILSPDVFQQSVMNNFHFT